MSDSKKIARNTIFLYIRMFLTMGISLYTSRIVLKTLGIEDYGTYTIVGGVVSMFGFFNSAMSSATQRFLAFEIGNGNQLKLKQTFNATLNIHFLIGIIILVLGETVGLWFVNNKLNVDPEKMSAVNWVYQFSILTFLVGVIQVPYNALIIARERMKIYAILSILEAALKLLILYLLILTPFDKIIFYSFLIFCVTFLIAFAYKTYSKKEFVESQYRFYYDKLLYMKLISYSGWNLFGNFAAVAKGQGINVILNLFFGTVVNAAYGIALQVQGTLNLMVTNFQTAINPQIIKSYAKQETELTIKRILQSAKYSYFLMLIIVGPIYFSIEYILKIWLDKVPTYTTEFLKLLLINILIDSISGPLMTGIQATGKIKWYQIIVGILVFLNLPISYLFLKIYNNPLYTFFISIIISVISLLFRLYYINKSLSLSIPLFLKEVILKLLIVSGIVIINNYLLNKFSPIIETFQLFLLNTLIISFIACISIFLIGITKKEKQIFLEILSKKIK